MNSGWRAGPAGARSSDIGARLRSSSCVGVAVAARHPGVLCLPPPPRASAGAHLRHRHRGQVGRRCGLETSRQGHDRLVELIKVWTGLAGSRRRSAAGTAIRRWRSPSAAGFPVRCARRRAAMPISTISWAWWNLSRRGGAEARQVADEVARRPRCDRRVGRKAERYIDRAAPDGDHDMFKIRLQAQAPRPTPPNSPCDDFVIYGDPGLVWRAGLRAKSARSDADDRPRPGRTRRSAAFNGCCCCAARQCRAGASGVASFEDTMTRPTIPGRLW